MLYFAYGSNLNHKQMAQRCKDSSFIKKFTLYISSNYLNRFRDKNNFNYEYTDIDNIGKNYRIVYTIFKFGETEKLKIWEKNIMLTNTVKQNIFYPQNHTRIY